MNRSILQLADIAQQPRCSHVLFPPSGDRSPIAIDRVEIRSGILAGYRKGSKAPVVQLPAGCAWVVYARSQLSILSAEESLRQSIEQTEALRKVQRDLKVDASPMVLVAGLDGDEEQDPNTGVYL